MPDPWDDPDVMIDRPDSTGVPRVDAVMDTVAVVGGVSLEQQVGVYERAHVELRAVLDDPDS